MTRFEYTKYYLDKYIISKPNVKEYTRPLSYKRWLYYYFTILVETISVLALKQKYSWSSVMIKYLQNLQSGFLNPYTFIQTEITKRCYTLQLSRHQDIESIHTAGINTLDIEKLENRYLLSGCADGSIYIHDVNNLTGRPHYTAKCICKVTKSSSDSHRYSVECASWYGGDSALFITSGTDKTLRIWDSNSLKPVETFISKGRIFHHECSTIPSSNPTVAVASSVNHIELIDLKTGSSVHELRGHDSSVFTCAWSPKEENLLATGGIDGKILLWDVRSGNCCLKQLDKNNTNGNKAVAHSGYVNGLKFTSDGLFLVSFGTDSKLRLWETQNGCNQSIDYILVKNDVRKSIQFAISNNSKPSLLYVPSEGNIYVIEMLSGKLINILYGHFHSVNCCIYREAYQELYSGGNDRNILLWTPDDSQREAYNENIDHESEKYVKNTSLKTEDAWSSDEDSFDLP